MKKMLSFCLVLSIVLSLSVTAFATNVNEATTKDSVGSVAEDITNTTMVGQDETQTKESDYGTVNKGNLGDEHKVDVYVSKAPTYVIAIPKTIILDGQSGIGEYSVAVKGDIEGTKQITIAPYKDAETPLNAENTLVLTQAGKSNITALVVQEKQSVVSADLLIDEYADAATLTGSITAENLSAGSWHGSFLMHISYDDVSGAGSSDTVEVKATLNDYTWAEIQTIAKGDEPLSNYNIQIGDTITDGTYTYYLVSDERNENYNGLVFMFKPGTKAYMNSTLTNNGGYVSSEMKPVVDAVYSMLPTDLQNAIKTVNVNCNDGDNNPTTIHTAENVMLFLPALREVSSYTEGSTGQYLDLEGNTFDYFGNPNTEQTNRHTIFGSDGWLRSACGGSSNGFWCVGSMGIIRSNATNKSLLVVPAFVVG